MAILSLNRAHWFLADFATIVSSQRARRATQPGIAP
jgi:hypothetical protein